MINHSFLINQKQTWIKANFCVNNETKSARHTFWSIGLTKWEWRWKKKIKLRIMLIITSNAIYVAIFPSVVRSIRRKLFVSASWKEFLAKVQRNWKRLVVLFKLTRSFNYVLSIVRKCWDLFLSGKYTWRNFIGISCLCAFFFSPSITYGLVEDQVSVIFIYLAVADSSSKIMMIV